MKFFLSFVTLLIFLSSQAFASTCVYNEMKPDRLALQKICFDNLLEPTKISTQDSQLGVHLYGDILLQNISTPGGRQLKILATDKNENSRTIHIQINIGIDGTPLALICKTSDNYELVTSL